MTGQARSVVFLPIVQVIEREDGRLTVEFDWFDSLNGEATDEGTHITIYAEEVAEALDEWLCTQPKSFVINRGKS
jgi:hypothetical protein